MNKPWWISAACLVVALLLMAWGFRNQTMQSAGGARYYVLMIDDYGTDAMQLKQGAQEAAAQLSASVSFLTCRRNAPVEVELGKLLDMLEPLEMDGMILPSCDKETLSRALALGKSKNVPIVCLFESGAPSVISVVSDDVQMGCQLGEDALAQGATQFVAFVDASDPGQRLIEGLTDVLDTVDVILCADGRQAVEKARTLPSATACFALSEELTLALAEVNSGISLWGVDPGEERVSLLESGKVLGLGMHMPYAQGYQAVITVANSAQSQKSPTRVITRETMYLSENVKLMFPLLQ